MSDADDALWRAQIAGAIPIKGGSRHAPPTLARVAKKPVIFQIERRSDDHTIDLHGLTLAEAHRAVVREIKRCAASDVRRLRIVTGKGAAGRRATIKSELKHWLEAKELAPLIVSIKSAPRERGGDGAVDVRIRRGDKVAR